MSLEGRGPQMDDQNNQVAPLNIDHFPPRVSPGFKIVCDECGNLSIKVTDPANAPSSTPVQCARCSAVRGTLGDLRALASQSRDVYEF